LDKLGFGESLAADRTILTRHDVNLLYQLR